MKYLKLSDCAYYSKLRTDNILIENYVTTDNMLPNKGGIKLAESIPNQRTASKYEINDILISNIRPYFRKIWFANREGSCSNDVLVIKSKSSYIPKFLYYVLSDNNFFNYDNVTSKGTKMPRGTPSAIMKYLVPDITIDKQKKIADILSKYDEFIENNTRRIELLKQTIECIYKEWFVRFRFPNHGNTEFKNGIPINWKIKNLKEVANITYGYAFNSSLFTEDITKIPVVRIRDIPNGTTDTYTTEICDKKYLININDILVGMDGIFHMDLWKEKNTYLNQRNLKIKSTENISQYYLFFAIYPQVKYWEQTISGTTVAHLGDKHINKMKIIIPSQDILNQFNTLANDIMNEIKNLWEKNQNLIRQRDLLLPRLMSGKLEVK